MPLMLAAITLCYAVFIERDVVYFTRACYAAAAMPITPPLRYYAAAIYAIIDLRHCFISLMAHSVVGR